MNTKRILGLGLLVALSACKGSCSCGTDDGDDGVGGSGVGGSDPSTVTVGTSGTGGTDGSGGSGTGGDTTSSTGGGSGTGGSAPIVDPTVRFLHLGSDATDVNFCLVDDAGTAIGPVIDGGLTFPEASAYGDIIGVGNYSVRVVDAAATDCDAADAPEFGPFPFADGGVYSITALGLVGDDTFDIAIYSDDLTFPAAGSTKLRFVHAASGAPAVDIGEYLDPERTQFVPYFTNVAFLDDAGYTDDVAAFTGATLTARAAGTESDLLDVADVDGPDGAIVNAYAIGNVTDGVDVFFVTDFAGN